MDRFVKGLRVRLSENVLHAEFRNLPGMVEKTVKSRRVVVVKLDNGRKYDAFPDNVIIESAGI
jgi:hypothetical protein